MESRNMAEETIIGIVKAYSTGKPDSIVIVIPKEAHGKLGEVRGKKFLVKTDSKGRLIYEPLESEGVS